MSFSKRAINFRQNNGKLNVLKQESNYELYGSAIYKLVDNEKVERFQRVIYVLIDIRKVKKKLFSLQLDSDLLNFRFQKKKKKKKTI